MKNTFVSERPGMEIEVERGVHFDNFFKEPTDNSINGIAIWVAGPTSGGIQSIYCVAGRKESEPGAYCKANGVFDRKTNDRTMQLFKVNLLHGFN